MSNEIKKFEQRIAKLEKKISEPKSENSELKKINSFTTYKPIIDIDEFKVKH